MERMRLIIAGGGSGGHFFPAQAIMNEIIRSRKDIEYLYIGSDSGIESKKWMLPETNRRLLTVRGFRNKKLTEKFSALFLLAAAMKKSYRIIREFKPDAVLGVGGYASFPVVMTAALMRIPSAIHEQNSVPGLANRILSGFVKKAFISFETSDSYLSKRKTVLTGLPIRFGLHKQRNFARPVKTISVFGGSQGAHQINKIVVSSLEALTDIKHKICFIHQTGREDYQWIKDAYKKYGYSAQVYDFIDDMAATFEKTDIAVSRAGASTLFELATYGIPSILIPYPSAASDHQTLNALELSDGGGAVTISSGTSDPAPLVKLLHEFISDDNRLKAMSEAMIKWAKPNAAATIINEMIRLSGEK